MPSLKELCEKYFGCTDFYDVLRISKDADEKQVRKAYHRLSLLVHPDRVEENKKIEATEKFKVLGKVHSILSDEEKRAVYDDTGEYDEEDEIAERDWTDYWRRMFKKITIEDINKYEKQYKGSEEELNDLKHAYVSGKGSFDWILETVPFTHVEEEERIHNLLQPLIDSGELPSFDESFSGESKRTKEKRKRKDKQDQQVVEDEDSTDMDCISETSTVSETHSSTDDGHLPSSKRRQYNPPELYQAKKQMNEAFSLLQYVCQQQQEEDEWTIFGKLIVMKMWRLLEEQRNFMMIKIDQILCEEQIQQAMFIAFNILQLCTLIPGQHTAGG